MSGSSLDTVDLAVTRAIEALTLFLGDSADGYPSWAKNLGEMVAREVLPRAFFSLAKEKPKAFCEGVLLGVSVTLGPPGPGLLDDPKTRMIVNSAAVSPMVDGQPLAILKAMESLPEAMKEMPAILAQYLTVDAITRKAFFSGFATGLDVDRMMQEITERFSKGLQNEKSLFVRHFYMWARWPQFDKMRSPDEAFQWCRKRFAEIGRPEIAGGKDAFRRFCSRVGYRSVKRKKSR